MFVELIDVLRCPVLHEPEPLIAAVDDLRDRHLWHGVLGCPRCLRQFSVREGELDLRLNDAAPKAERGGSWSLTDDELFRMRALLDLTSPGGVVALVGGATLLASRMEIEADVSVLAVNPSGPSPSAASAAIRADARLTLAPNALRGLVVDGAVGADVVGGLVAALKTGARVIGGVEAPVPTEVSELARDSRHWVGVKSASPGTFHRLERRSS